jgi:hypothetical protein
MNHSVCESVRCFPCTTLTNDRHAARYDRTKLFYQEDDEGIGVFCKRVCETRPYSMVLSRVDVLPIQWLDAIFAARTIWQATFWRRSISYASIVTRSAPRRLPRRLPRDDTRVSLRVSCIALHCTYCQIGSHDVHLVHLGDCLQISEAEGIQVWCID